MNNPSNSGDSFPAPTDFSEFGDKSREYSDLFFLANAIGSALADHNAGRKPVRTIGEIHEALTDYCVSVASRDPETGRQLLEALDRPDEYGLQGSMELVAEVRRQLSAPESY